MAALMTKRLISLSTDCIFICQVWPFYDLQRNVVKHKAQRSRLKVLSLQRLAHLESTGTRALVPFFQANFGCATCSRPGNSTT